MNIMKNLGTRGEALIRSSAFSLLLVFIVGFLAGGYVLAFTVLQEEPAPSTWDKFVDLVKGNVMLITAVTVVIIAVGAGLYVWGAKGRRFR